MGVKGLSYIATSSTATSRVDIKNLDIDAIYVDALNLCSYIAHKPGKYSLLGTDEQQFTNRYNNFIDYLSQANKPIYVVTDAFEDYSRHMIKDERAIRDTGRMTNIVNNFEFPIDMRKTYKCLTSFITSQIFVVAYAKNPKTTTIIANGEADNFIASQVQKQKCLVVSSDSDFIISNYNGYNILLSAQKHLDLDNPIKYHLNVLNCSKFIKNVMGFHKLNDASYLQILANSDLTFTNTNYDKLKVKLYARRQPTDIGEQIACIKKLIYGEKKKLLEAMKADEELNILLESRLEYCYPSADMKHYQIYNDYEKCVKILYESKRRSMLYRVTLKKTCLGIDTSKKITKYLQKIVDEYKEDQALVSRQIIASLGDIKATMNTVSAELGYDYIINTVTEIREIPNVLSKKIFTDLCMLIYIYEIAILINILFERKVERLTIKNIYSNL